MSQPSLKKVLATLADGSKINVNLSDGNRLSLIDWSLAEDCLIERWPSGKTRFLVPLSQIVAIEVPDEG